MSVIDDINKAHLQAVENTKRAEEMNQALKGTNGTTGTSDYQPGQFYKEYTDKNKKPTLEVDEKTQQRNLRLARIGDALSAFHTAYANARGMKPMVNPGESLSGKMRERYDRLNKEYEARTKEYNAGLMRAKQMDAENTLRWQALKEKAEARKAAEARYEQERQDKLKDREEQNRLKQQNFELQKQIADDKRKGVGAYAKTSGRGGTTSRQNQGWTTTVTDNKGNVKSRTVREYGSGGSGQQQGGNGNQTKDKNGKIIIKY